MHSSEGLTGIVACTSKLEPHAFTAKLKFDIGILMNTLPKNFKLQHPFPKSHPYPRKGLEMIREIKSAFEFEGLQLSLYVPLTRPKATLPSLDSGGSLVHLSPRRSKTTMTAHNLYTRSHTIDFTNTEHSATTKFWNIDYDVIEKIIASHVRHQSSYRIIQEAFKLYSVLIHTGNSPLPALNERTKRALGLWLYKQKGQDMKDFHDAFKALLEIAGSCFAKGFCPSFCQPSSNTMDQKDNNQPSGYHSDAESDREYTEDDDTDEENDEDDDSKNPIQKLLKIIEMNQVAKAVEFIQIY